MASKEQQKENQPTKATISGIDSAAQGLPDFMLERNRFFDQLYKARAEELAGKPRDPIKVTLYTAADNTPPVEVEGISWSTTPGQLLKNVPKEFAGAIVVAKVDGGLWDLTRPLEKDCKVSYLSSEDSEGRSVFWHSAAHMLGEAAEHEYHCLLSHGPPTTTGFFYDMALEPGRTVHQTEWPSIEARVKKFAKEKQQFERLEVSKGNLRKMFAYSKYKMEFVEKFIPDGGSSTVYRNGSLVDLCLGPHIQNTKQIGAFKVTSNSSAYFLGDQSNDSLQRIYGVAFGKADEMKKWETWLKEAKARDHQEIGKNQKLFWFSELSPGSPFFLPHGTRIFNAIQAMLREQYWQRGYDEVHSPLMYDVELWKTSGHWQHYRDDMFRVPFRSTVIPDNVDVKSPAEKNDKDKGLQEGVDVSKTSAADKDRDRGLFALKPMNCPGHCVMFASEERSYRSLPWRVADFSVLHRNEASGALSGLTRVRKFQQDDAHIFCTPEQIGTELKGMFDFMTYVYDMFGFPFKLRLSTRPDSYMGKLEDWNAAEEQLKQALQGFRGDNWTLNPGDGAFYGPKIDVAVSDALGREFQCATIQLDFQLPQNFDLLYRTGEVQGASAAAKPSEEPAADASGKKAAGHRAVPQGMARPVMIHRAVVGSFDRFIAVITEHFGGKWPFWLSPRQVMIIPVMKSAEDYASEIQSMLHNARMYVDVDFTGNTLQKKIRNAQLAQYNFVLVVGAEEVESRAVNIRNRDDPTTQQKGAMMQLDEVVSKMKALRDERRLKNSLDPEAEEKKAAEKK